ncbi:MAG: hypothetical protein EOR68_23405 [Mesorhizobium sp.]|uniref:hypothetical protein n=1 Tax=Mesorhizobium sp. TaxID=1871066 RepID=UPI000FE77B80|nr:hypothetical protein [Mesorhizobium sp.]RWL93732.1 MAG: hypothetical protein EOR68_23405 [Mesorhizobium sp.]TIP36466.1 MAG: hypothetical protein E5X77_36700 [Mesorhizobium sp.]
MDEAAILKLMNEGRDQMTFKQKRVWDAISIDPEPWLYRNSEGHDNHVWVVAVIGRSVISYNEWDSGFDRSQFVRYGEIAQFGWGDGSLGAVVQDVLNELELGHRTAPTVSGPNPGTFPSKG